VNPPTCICAKTVSAGLCLLSILFNLPIVADLARASASALNLPNRTCHSQASATRRTSISTAQCMSAGNAANDASAGSL
jgi:hypothetical protein